MGAMGFNPDAKMEEDVYAEVARLKKEKSVLIRRLNRMEERVHVSETLKEIIHDVADVKFDKKPKWLNKPKDGVKTKGVPLLLIGDIHFDEVVRPEQIAFANQYNRAIAERRIKHVFSKARDLFMDYTVKPQYPGVVLLLLGDMLSGNIHEELRQTNETVIFKSLISLIDIFYNAVSEYADTFNRVYVPCVVGNHGRVNKKPQAKNKVHENFDWLFYHFLARQFKDDDRIVFEIPDGPDVRFPIYDTRFLATHGDQFRGGSGIQGFQLPLLLGQFRKIKKQLSLKQPFDVMVTGHFHQTLPGKQLIVNGSIKGYDEWADNQNFAPEPPQQSAYIYHWNHGMIHYMPVYCDVNHNKKEPKRAIVF